MNLEPVPNKAVTGTVTINKQMKLQTIATLAHTSVHTVKKLNPALRRSVTPPHQTLTLVLPVSEKKMFVKHLAAHKKMQKEIAGKSLAHYSVKHGDSLGGIALEFKTTIKTLQKINQLHDGIIRIHQVLLVPRLIAEADKNLTTTKVASQKKTYHVSHKNTYYTVKPGDHLWGIAAKMHVSHAHIEAWNHINARTSLRIGEKLVVSEKITRVATATHNVFSKNTRKIFA